MPAKNKTLEQLHELVRGLNFTIKNRPVNKINEHDEIKYIKQLNYYTRVIRARKLKGLRAQLRKMNIIT